MFNHHQEHMLVKLKQEELERKSRHAWKFFERPDAVTKTIKSVQSNTVTDCCVSICEA